MRLLRRLGWLVLALLIVATPWAFAYGPLFPWSVVKPGYDHVALSRADVYYPKGTALDPAYLEVDRYLAEAEAFHDLRLMRRVSIIACTQWGDFYRFSPWTPSRTVAGVTLETGTVIYISPKVGEKRLDTSEFLRHEISHAIVSQNLTFRGQFHLRHQTWLFEGVPVWFGRQQAYVSQEEFLARAHDVDLVPYFEFDANAWHRRPVDMRFGYIAWRDFLDYLVQRRGRETFQRFFHGVMESTGEVGPAFERSYGHSLRDEVREFQAVVRANGYHPQ